MKSKNRVVRKKQTKNENIKEILRKKQKKKLRRMK